MLHWCWTAAQDWRVESKNIKSYIFHCTFASEVEQLARAVWAGRAYLLFLVAALPLPPVAEQSNSSVVSASVEGDRTWPLLLTLVAALPPPPLPSKAAVASRSPSVQGQSVVADASFSCRAPPLLLSKEVAACLLLNQGTDCSN